MSAGIFDTRKSFILENDFVKIEFSKKDAEVLSVVEKATGKNIAREEKVFFFEFFNDKDESLGVTGVDFDGDVANVSSTLGTVQVKIDVCNSHFVFEVVSDKLPDGVFYFSFARIAFDYDFKDEKAIRAAGIAMTVNANPCFYPSGESREVRATTYEYLGGSKGARFGMCVVPCSILRQTLKEIGEKIDPEKGIVSKNAGPWARDSRMGFGSYMIDYDSSTEYISSRMDFYKELGVDQIDFHKGGGTYRQGDFKYMKQADAAAWCENVARPLKENGMDIGLHTYAYYIDPTCHEILSDKKKREMIDTSAEFTLAEDISADAPELKVEEDISELSCYYGFFSTDMPYLLIGDEIMYFNRTDAHGMRVGRGYCGTVASAHKKGEKVIRLKGLFNLLSPRPSTDLFIEIAHNTARTYNEGEFAMIYLDALDGIGRHCKPCEQWYYAARFVHEIVKNCKTPPIIEYSTMYPSIWAARARMGATDTPFRAYKAFNHAHHMGNQDSVKRHYACTLGWYNYYPTTDRYPGNQHTKYHHWDAVDHMGAISVMYDYSTVFNGTNPEGLLRYAGNRRNVALYNMYADLRKSFYFSEELLEKVRATGLEYKIEKKKNGKYVFVEKDYQVKRLYSILEEGRNTAEFSNPFKKQTPFVRIEHCMSTLGEEEMILLPLNEHAPVSAQTRVHKFGGEINLCEKLAMKVRVKGNGKKGAVGIKTRCATNSEHGYGLYIIETDFEGWRDFVLLEADNGDRPDLGFDANESFYPIYRSGLNMDRITQVELEVKGDVEGVQMSSVVACRQTYNVWKNPTVKIGDESVMFECELMSTDFIEWDGKEAKVIDRYGNEKTVWFTGNITAPKGKVKASLSGVSLNNCPVNAYLTLGFTGKEVK